VGSDPRFWLKLPAHFVNAGIGTPDGTDVGALHVPLAELLPILGQAFRSALPVSIAHALITESEAEVVLADLEEAARDDEVRALSPLLIGAWKRKPA
jgi:hypothetical protein